MAEHLHTIGFLLILLALLHVIFPKRFKWKEELENASVLTRQIMYVHTFFIALVVLLMGVLSLCYAHLLESSELGNVTCAGMAIFWFLRLFFQVFVYSRSLWRGKLFETVVHIVFTLMWVYFTIVYTLIAVGA